MKRSPRKTLIRKLDKLWSKTIRAKFPKCVVCGGSPTQAHHCIVRKAQSFGVRWLESNGIGLCYVCHLHKLHGQQGDKQFLDRYLEVVNESISQDEQDNIMSIGHRVNKFGLSSLEQMVKDFEDKENNNA